MKEEKKLGKAFDRKLFARVFRNARKYRLVFALSGISAILISAFSVLTPSLVGALIDNAITNRNAELLFQLIMAMLLVLIGEVSFQLIFTYTANLLGELVIRDLRIQLFKKILRFKMTYFDRSAIGILVTRAVSDMQKIGEIFSQGFFTIIADLLKMFVVACVMLYLNFRLSLVVFGVLPILLIATRWFQQAMKLAFVEVRAQVAQLNAFVQERLNGIRIVQLFNRFNQEQQKFININEKHQNAWLRTVWYNSIFFALAELIASITTGLIVWYGGLQNVGGIRAEEYGDIFTFILLSSMLFRPLRHIADKFNVLQMGMVAASRVFAILDTESKIDDAGSETAPRLQGAIEFKDVRFSYVEGEEVLKGISLKIKPGSKVAIVGSTGAGKSTIINLLNRFYDIDSGEISVDGVNIKDFTLDSLRSNIAVVLQDVFLFADTIANNISLKKESISLEKIKEAAKQIGVDEFIERLPDTYAYNVKERGSMLSSGQRQLISFLRAYVSDPSILILDEATSSIDSESEQLIQKASMKITEGRTSIIIAHRLATIQSADVIYVMLRADC
jgi:ATP-binding cassette subfamily B multidrug efflux pump